MRQSIQASADQENGDWADARGVVEAYFTMFPRAPGGFGVFFKPGELLVASEVEDPLADGYQLAILEPLPSHMDRIGLVQWVRERIRQVAYRVRKAE